MANWRFYLMFGGILLFLLAGWYVSNLKQKLQEEQVKSATPGWVHRADYLDGDLDREARFTMLTNVSMPAVLSENGFFTNYSDAGLMIDIKWQQTIAKAHAKGILDYAVQQGVEWE